MYGLALFLAGGFGYAMGRANAHEAFNRVMGGMLAAIRKHLRAEAGEARETRRAAAQLARFAVDFVETAEKTSPTAEEQKAIIESLQEKGSAEVAAKLRFRDLYQREKMARDSIESERDTLVCINRVLSRRMAAAFATCRNGCLEASERASTATATAEAEAANPGSRFPKGGEP